MSNVVVSILVASLIAGLALLAPGTSRAEERTVEGASADEAGITIEKLAKFKKPWAVKAMPDGRLLVTEKAGKLRIFADGKVSDPIKGVPEVEDRDQGGLLDVALDPGFAENGVIYLSYTERAAKQPDVESDTPDHRFLDFLDLTDNVLKGGAVARAKLNGDSLEDLQVIWRQDPKTIGRGHFGGRIVPTNDGKLFITSGDRQRFDPAQDLSGNLGKIVRINNDGSIPDDNPFVGQSGAHPDIWTLGNRNPLGAAINPKTGELWINEMGPKGGDELNIIVKGKNYGWPIVSNGDHYDDTKIPRHDTRPEFQAPVYSWNPSISPAGLIFYGGDLFEGWKGSALFGGLSSKALFRMSLDGNKVTKEEKIDMGRRVRDVAEAPDGSLLVLIDGQSGGHLLRLTPKSAKAAQRGGARHDSVN